MRKKITTKHNYSSKTQHGVFGLIVLSFLCVLLAGTTLAYLYADDFSTNMIGLSGKVDIEAVSRGNTYTSIQDTTDTKLIIYVEDDYEVHIPGGWFEPTANVKVYNSTTKPLLRAKMSVELIDMTTSQVVTDEEVDIYNLAERLYDSLEVIVIDNGWVFYDVDNYYYYRGTNAINSQVGNTIMHEVDATEDDAFVHFIDSKIQFPEDIDSSYSGYGVRLIITFEAIQNYIPDSDGNQLSNTIINSKLIFDNPTSNPYE